MLFKIYSILIVFTFSMAPSIGQDIIFGGSTSIGKEYWKWDFTTGVQVNRIEYILGLSTKEDMAGSTGIFSSHNVSPKEEYYCIHVASLWRILSDGVLFKFGMGPSYNKGIKRGKFLYTTKSNHWLAGSSRSDYYERVDINEIGIMMQAAIYPMVYDVFDLGLNYKMFASENMTDHRVMLSLIIHFNYKPQEYQNNSAANLGS